MRKLHKYLAGVLLAIALCFLPACVDGGDDSDASESSVVPAINITNSEGAQVTVDVTVDDSRHRSTVVTTTTTADNRTSETTTTTGGQ
jgi:uncharacterized lipoprotein YajG